MSGRAFEILAPFAEAERGAEYVGEVPLAVLKRLAGAVHSMCGAAGYQLRLGAGGAHRYRIAGVVKASLELVCQRCLQPYTQQISSEFELALVRSDAEAQRALEVDEVESVLVSDNVLRIDELVEDELLLALPVAPKHESVEFCDLPLQGVLTAGSPRNDGEPRESPFAELLRLTKRH